MKVIILTILLLSLFSCAFAQEARKIDEFDGNYCELYLAQMDGIKSYFEAEPLSKIYFFVYEGKEYIYNRRNSKSELVFPTRNAAKTKIISMKKYLGNVENTVYIEAGFREKSIVEVWIVPNSSTPPKPTPTLTKMKYRKGKSKGFCLNSGA